MLHLVCEINNNNKGFRLTWVHFTLTHFEGQCQGHALFTATILEMMIDRENITIAIIYKVMPKFSIGTFTCNLDPF